MRNIIIVITAIIIIALGGGAYYYVSIYKKSPGQTQTVQDQADANKVQAQDVKVGTGKEAIPGSKVSVLYVGMLPDGTVFDSSAAHNNEPLVFILGSDGLIPGFQIGVNGMKEGGERLMRIPSPLGYGDKDVKDSTGKVIIPAKSAIVFRVSLVKVEQALAPSAAAVPAAKAKQ